MAGKNIKVAISNPPTGKEQRPVTEKKERSVSVKETYLAKTTPAYVLSVMLIC